MCRHFGNPYVELYVDKLMDCVELLGHGVTVTLLSIYTRSIAQVTSMYLQANE